MNLDALTRPLSSNELEWKVQTCGKSGQRFWAIIVPYVTARSVMARFDEAFGVLGWQVEYYFHEPINPSKDLSPGMKCKVSVYNPELKEWISKEDGAESTDIEAYKGAISSALKRTAVCFGIGRELYEYEVTYAEIVDKQTKGARYAKTKDGEVFHWIEPKTGESRENDGGFDARSNGNNFVGTTRDDVRNFQTIQTTGGIINAPIQTISRNNQSGNQPAKEIRSNQTGLPKLEKEQPGIVSGGSRASPGAVQQIQAVREQVGVYGVRVGGEAQAGTTEGQQEQKEVSEQERKSLTSLAFNIGWTREFVLGELKRRYNVTSTVSLNREQFDEFAELIKNNPQIRKES
jgi:hypothetical protein